MHYLLTIAVVILGIGLALTVMGLSGHKRPVDTDGDGAADTTKRRMRPVPLVLGLLFLIVGGVGTAMVLMEGLDSPRYDQFVMRNTSASTLIDRLDDKLQTTRLETARELTRRYEAGELSSEDRATLAKKWAAATTDDKDSPDMPRYKDSVVDIDPQAERAAGNISDESWALVLAEWVPKQLRVPSTVAIGSGLPLNYVIGLDFEAPIKIWAIARFEELSFADKDVALPDAALVAPNPALPEISEAQGSPSSVGDDDPFPIASTPEGGTGGPPAPAMSRFTDLIPPDVIAAAGAGEHQLSGRFVVYIFDAAKTPIPADLVGSTGEESEEIPRTVTARLTKEQADALIKNALGKEEQPVRARTITVTDSTPDPEATTSPAVPTNG